MLVLTFDVVTCGEVATGPEFFSHVVGSSVISIVSIVSLIVGLFVVFVLTDEHGGGVWSLEVHVCFCS